MADFNYTGGVRFAPDKVVDVTADKDGNPTKACNPITGVCLEGGGGDFETADVTVKYYNTETNYGFSCVTVSEDGYASTDGVNLKNYGEDWSGKLLVKSVLHFNFATVTCTATGDIEVVASPFGSVCIINGDGEITITDVTDPGI